MGGLMSIVLLFSAVETTLHRVTRQRHKAKLLLRPPPLCIPMAYCVLKAHLLFVILTSKELFRTHLFLRTISTMARQALQDLRPSSQLALFLYGMLFIAVRPIISFVTRPCVYLVYKFKAVTEPPETYVSCARVRV